MAWIAFNAKGKKDNMEVLEGLVMDGPDYKVHPKLKALGGNGVPTLNHDGKVIVGSTECIEYIDKTFGEKNTLIPEDKELRRLTLYCENYVIQNYPWGFYPMLLYQDAKHQKKCKVRLTWDIFYLQ